MTIDTIERLQAENIKPLIGSRVLNSKQALLSGELADDLRELLEHRGVLVLRGIFLTDEEQIAFTRTLGNFLPDKPDQDILSISLDKKINAHSDYLKGSLFWHIDGTMSQLPTGVAVLSTKVLPTWGGNTEFCNTYAAYEALPEERKQEIDSLRVHHCMWNTQLYHTPEPTLAQLEEWMAIGENELPLVWKHRLSRKSLVLGNTAQYVIGMERKESARLLHGLRDWATREQFHYAHEWQEGDTVIWDNTGTMHRAMPYDPDCGRRLSRTRTSSEEPFA